MYHRVASRWIGRLANVAEVVFIGVFLSPAERKRLLKRFPPVHSEVNAYHMTIWYNEDGIIDPEILSLNFGEQVTLQITGYAENAKGQAVTIKPMPELRYQNRTPHITLSVASGVSPVYSNALIKKGTEPATFTLRGKIGWWDGKEVHYEPPSKD